MNLAYVSYVVYVISFLVLGAVADRVNWMRGTVNDIRKLMAVITTDTIPVSSHFADIPANNLASILNTVVPWQYYTTKILSIAWIVGVISTVVMVSGYTTAALYTQAIFIVLVLAAMYQWVKYKDKRSRATIAYLVTFVSVVEYRATVGNKLLTDCHDGCVTDQQLLYTLRLMLTPSTATPSNRLPDVSDQELLQLWGTHKTSMQSVISSMINEHHKSVDRLTPLIKFTQHTLAQ